VRYILKQIFSFVSLFLFLFTIPILGESKEKVLSEMESYFPAEKEDAKVFMGVGGASILLGSYYAAQNDQFSRGLSAPLLGLGLAEAITGSIVYFRTDKQLELNKKKLDSDTKKFRDYENDRMYRVNRNRGIYRGVEAALLGMGLLLIHQGQQERDNSLLANLQGGNEKGDYKRGLGTGLVVQTSFLLIMDFIAEKRARNYSEALYNFHAIYNPPTRDREGVYGLGATIRF
jgi:hypothetical protein